MGSESATPKLIRRFPFRKVLLAVLVLAVVGGGYAVYERYFVPTSVKITQETALLNKAATQRDTAQALEHAKKILSYEPNNINAITTVAYLEQSSNPRQAKQYFAQALAEYKKQNNPDVSGKTAETYWAAAGLAMQAGQTAQAKHYYQQVITAAKPSDKYEQSLAAQSQAALKSLQ